MNIYLCAKMAFQEIYQARLNKAWYISGFFLFKCYCYFY